MLVLDRGVFIAKIAIGISFFNVHCTESDINFTENILKFTTYRARSSAGEHYVDIVGVAGSIPAVPTIIFKDLALLTHCLRWLLGHLWDSEVKNGSYREAQGQLESQGQEDWFPFGQQNIPQTKGCLQLGS